MRTHLDLQPGQRYRVTVGGFSLVHYVRGNSGGERKCCRRALEHDEIITCLPDGADPGPTLKFRTEDGIEGRWFPTATDGGVPPFALECFHGPSKPAGALSQKPTPTAADTHRDMTPVAHAPVSHPDASPPSQSRISCLDRLRRAWVQATNGERIAFMEWVLQAEAAAEKGARQAEGE